LLKLLLVPAVKSRAAVAVSLRSASPEGPTSPLSLGGPSVFKILYAGQVSHTYGAAELTGPANRLREEADVPLGRYKTKFAWDVSARRDGEHFRVFYRHHYPNRVEETRDTRRFNTLAEAEKFAEAMRQTERFYRDLS
jgi:hypothetical protein